MTHQAFRSVPASLPLLGAAQGKEATWAEVGDLIRRFCADHGRHGFRLAGPGRSGHLFIDQGQVIHAEYGEDFGLNAVFQLLRAGPMRLEQWTGAWPRQGSIRLSPERLLAAPNRREPSPPADTGVVRKVALPVAGPPALSPVSAPLQPQAAPTTMVRLSTRGLLLTARGKDAARLADAAALIHGLAQRIAADLGQRGPASVHLRGRERSLLVMRSEVNDIAAAYGRTRRLASLLRKAGLR
jgi:hypothetical protein